MKFIINVAITCFYQKGEGKEGEEGEVIYIAHQLKTGCLGVTGSTMRVADGGKMIG